MDSVSNQLVGKTGEVAIVRRRLTKAEDSYKSQTEAGDRIRKNLEDRLEAKERELKAEVARMMVDQAFRVRSFINLRLLFGARFLMRYL